MMPQSVFHWDPSFFWPLIKVTTLYPSPNTTLLKIKANGPVEQGFGVERPIDDIYVILAHQG
jgi:hypothetical protein